MKKENIEEMSILEKIEAPTPKKDKIIGKITTLIGGACAITLTLGVVANPVGILALTIGSIVFGGDAFFRAKKIDIESLKKLNELKK
jgi:hypothetical protein